MAPGYFLARRSAPPFAAANGNSFATRSEPPRRRRQRIFLCNAIRAPVLPPAETLLQCDPLPMPSAADTRSRCAPSPCRYRSLLRWLFLPAPPMRAERGSARRRASRKWRSASAGARIGEEQGDARLRAEPVVGSQSNSHCEAASGAGGGQPKQFELRGCERSGVGQRCERGEAVSGAVLDNAASAAREAPRYAGQEVS